MYISAVRFFMLFGFVFTKVTQVMAGNEAILYCLLFAISLIVTIHTVKSFSLFSILHNIFVKRAKSVGYYIYFL